MNELLRWVFKREEEREMDQRRKENFERRFLAKRNEIFQ
jgi:hypothetical protein